MTDYQGNDIYCDLIIPRKIDIEVVKETDNILAFYHTKPHWTVRHILVTPKKHIGSLLDLPNNLEIAHELLEVVAEIAKQVEDQEGACRIVTNLGDYQHSKHLHIHIAKGPAKSEDI